GILSLNHDNLTVDNMTCSDATICVSAWGNNMVVSNSTMSKCNRCIVTGTNIPTTGYTIHDNHITHDATWDATDGYYHHDGIHAFPFSPGNMTGVLIYNNLFDGGGFNNTAHVYLQGTFTSPKIFNNVFNDSPNFNMRHIQFEATGQSITNPFIVN